jgi:hypothetical protein
MFLLRTYVHVVVSWSSEIHTGHSYVRRTNRRRNVPVYKLYTVDVRRLEGAVINIIYIYALLYEVVVGCFVHFSGRF